MSDNLLDAWERFELEAKKESTAVEQVVLTFVGGILNFLVLSITVHQHPILIANLDWVHMGTTIVVAFLTLIVYCAACAHVFLPQKRLVRPIDVTAITTVLMLIRYYRFPTFVFAILAVVILFLIGGVADRVARMVIGLGNMGTHSNTLEVASSLKVVESKIGIDVRDSLELKRGKPLHDGKVVVYRSKREDYRFYVVLAEHPVSSEATLIHFEAYNVGQYSIGESPGSKRRFDKDISYFKRVLREKIPHIRMIDAKFDHTFPFRTEIKRILLEPAESKITMVLRLPLRSIIVLIGVILLGIAYYLYPSGAQNAAFAAVVGALLVLVPTIPFIRGPTGGGRWQEED